MGMTRPYAVGDWVIYTREKYSPSPGPRAKNVSPAPHGELYSYEVDKYWAVSEVLGSGEIVLQTRRGKCHPVKSGDPRLRRAAWWERLIYSQRFPSAATLDSANLAEGNQGSSAA